MTRSHLSAITLIVRAATMLVVPTSLWAEVVTFNGSSWNHGGGPQPAWQAPPTPETTPYSGWTELGDGTTLTITVSNHGTVTHFGDAVDHLQVIAGGAGGLLNINQNSARAKNLNGVIQNYVRIDFELSEARYISQYWHDIDMGYDWDLDGDGAPDLTDWTDILYIESYVGAFGAIGTGQTAMVELGSDLQIVERGGLPTITPLPQTANLNHEGIVDDTILSSNSLRVGFNAPVARFSLFYWNDNPLANYADIQRILLGQTSVTTSPYPMNHFLEMSSVPEPTSMLLISTCLTGYVVRRRRRDSVNS